jgi:hypothetical protein
MTALTQARLKELLRYDPETGVLTWRVKRWRAKAGDVAGWRSGRNIHICIEQKCYLAHRLAWLYVHGQFPERDIDHIDGDPLNNRIANLRECSQAENQQNRSAFGSKRNTSGHNGINWDRARGKWLVRVRAYGVNHYGGRFQNLADAVKARDALKAKVHKFQPAHRDLTAALSDMDARREVTRLADMLREVA